MLSTIIRDPRIFQFLLLAIYSANVVRWSFERRWGNVLYWLGAGLITVGITFFKYGSAK
jgi:hypothetical protein